MGVTEEGFGMITSLPKNVEDGSERLRILWIEDRPGVVPEKSFGTVGNKTVQIVIAETAGDVWQLLNKEQNSFHLKQGFDAYITDFRLVDRPSEKTGEETSRPREIRVPGREYPTEGELGADAPAAGLLIGLLASLRFPDRPSVILPYSRFSEEFGATWRLVKNFAPLGPALADSNQINKEKMEQQQLLNEASACFRRTLVEWIRADRIALRGDELDMLVNTGGSGVAYSQPLTIIQENSARTIMVGALFLNDDVSLSTGVPIEAIREFVSSLPPRDEGYINARRLAEQFISAAEEDASIRLYAKTFEELDRGAGYPLVKNLKHSPWLGEGDAWQNSVDRRNAFLMILVYLYARYVLPVTLIFDYQSDLNVNASMPTAKAIKDLVHEHKLQSFPVVYRGLDDLTKSVLKPAGISPDDPLELALDELCEQFEQATKIRQIRWERLIHRYVDPNPGEVTLIRPRISNAERIGQGLKRLLSAGGEDRAGGRLKGLLEDRRCLNHGFLRVPRIYARETLPPSVKWPAWLLPLNEAQGASSEVKDDAVGPKP
jgi:hypothetical protein